MTTPYHLGIYLRSLPIPALGRQCRPLLSVQTHIPKRRNVSRRFVSYDKMAEAKEFPPRSVRPIVNEVVALLKERHETVSVAETVRILCFLSNSLLQQSSSSRFSASKEELYDFLRKKTGARIGTCTGWPLLIIGTLLTWITGSWWNHFCFIAQRSRSECHLQGWTDGQSRLLLLPLSVL